MKLEPENNPQYQLMSLKEQSTKSDDTNSPSTDRPSNAQNLKYPSSHSISVMFSELIVSDRTVCPFPVAVRISLLPRRPNSFPSQRIFGSRAVPGKSAFQQFHLAADRSEAKLPGHSRFVPSFFRFRTRACIPPLPDSVHLRTAAFGYGQS